MKATVTLPKRTRYPLSVQRRFKPVTATSALKRLQIKKVLVPVDFSPSSHEAIKFALPFLKKFGAELHLVHVIARDIPLAGLAAMPIIVSETESAARAHLHLRRAAKTCAVDLETAKIHVIHGEPFNEICRLAREIDIDLIFISTRGQTGFKHLLLGSTAERVVRYSPCPVLVLKPQLRRGGKAKLQPEKLRFDKILVPIDFSDCSEKGFNYARALAQQFGSKMVLFNSVALTYYISSDEYARYDLPQLVESVERASRKKMQQLVQKAGLNKTNADTSVVVGHAGQQICARADRPDIDLIVTSTHGRTGFKHVLIGSTAEYVVQHAACPVLVVPAHERPRMDSTGDKK